MAMKKMGKEEKKWLTITVFLLLFFVFLIFKIFGYFDFTGKYKIKTMFCEKEYQNLLFTLDGDEKTTWGMNAEFSKGENYIFNFREKRNISELQILNAEMEICPTKKIEIFMTADDTAWQQCKIASVNTNGEITTYVLEQPCQVERLLLQYAEEVPGHWPITEFYIK